MGLSIVGAALMVRFIAAQKRDVDYRLLVACAYLGMGCTWHAGLSASAPLLVATPGHFLEKDIGLIPVGETIFSPFNLILVAAVFLFSASSRRCFIPGARRRSPSTRNCSTDSKICRARATSRADAIREAGTLLSHECGLRASRNGVGRLVLLR